MSLPAPLGEFIEACVRLSSTGDHAAASRLLGALIRDHEAMAATLSHFDSTATSEPGWTLGREHIYYSSSELTIAVIETLPGILQPPHDHTMHAIIGVFEGREDQRFFSRTADGVVPLSSRSVVAGEVIVLGERAIHAISSPNGETARAIHVYFGDIYAVKRSVYHPESFERYDFTTDRYDQFCRLDG